MKIIDKKWQLFVLVKYFLVETEAEDIKIKYVAYSVFTFFLMELLHFDHLIVTV